MLQYNELLEVPRGLGIYIERLWLVFLELRKKGTCVKVYYALEIVTSLRCNFLKYRTYYVSSKKLFEIVKIKAPILLRYNEKLSQVVLYMK